MWNVRNQFEKRTYYVCVVCKDILNSKDECIKHAENCQINSIDKNQLDLFEDVLHYKE